MQLRTSSISDGDCRRESYVCLQRQRCLTDAATTQDLHVMSATSNGHAVAICGTSYGTLPGYPSNEVGHWLASDGYYNNGDKIWIADPAKSSEVSWSNSISASYDVSASTLNNFVGWKGIVW